MSKNINIMTKIKRILGNHCFINIYYTLVYPYLIYGCFLWGNTYDSPLSQLIRLQNKVVRIMNDVPLRDSITPHYVNSGLLQFRDIVKYIRKFCPTVVGKYYWNDLSLSVRSILSKRLFKKAFYKYHFAQY